MNEAKIYVVSDLHTDYQENSKWVESLGRYDGALVVAGDISHKYETLEKTFLQLRDRFSQVYFVPGNHELWVDDTKEDGDSIRKFNKVIQLCERLGVQTNPNVFQGFQIIPLFSWYDLIPYKTSLWIPVPNGILSDNETSWSDTFKCKWNGELLLNSNLRTQYFLDMNEQRINQFQERQKGKGVSLPAITFAHFFSHDEQLERHNDLYKRTNRGLFEPNVHGGNWPNFSLVAGSSRLGEQVNQLKPLIHIYGHSHRGRDWKSVENNGIRFVNVPLGYPLERIKGRVSPISEPLLL